MAQVVVYGHRDSLRARRAALSDAIHGAVMAALGYPAEKRFQRFIPLDDEDFIHPDDRGTDYTIVEISLFEGRSERARRQLIQELFDRIEQATGTAPHSVEITLFETPRASWGIRGMNASDLQLGYAVDV
ncbi:tautomerase family protein [Desertihabitans brevis]|uniref:Tautomerase family protein n=1 Tax=Desertihabitans brevis TaxID=2268447 RepID=A0A367YZ28_9ACTN|nr:tautomerase family protein [Desertihabitans brevis]RCK71094.1 tautomerase family protein [Desertihabitans brevis]